jgi:hypothetical protein
MSNKTTNAKISKKRSSIRHTRAIRRNRSKRVLTIPPAQEVEDHLRELIVPVAEAQQEEYKKLKMRNRILNLSVMTAIVIAMIWQQMGSGPSEIARLLPMGSVLWLPVLYATQQAISLRLADFPPSLFLGMLNSLLPVLHERWHARKRPLLPEIAHAVEQYSQVLAVDGSTLDVLLRKIGLLCGLSVPPLAGKMMAMLDLASRLPVKIWFNPDPKVHDQTFWENILAVLPKGALLLFDKGFICYKRFTQLSLANIFFITRAKSDMKYQFVQAIVKTSKVHDYLIWIGEGNTRQQLRLIEVLYGDKWYRYLTNELDAERLPWKYVVAIYWQRWRIEDAFLIAKELLGLSYFWTGAQNGVELQVWVTWMLYAILLDLTDSLASALWRPLAEISIEMVFRGFGYFAQAILKGETAKLIPFLVAHTEHLGLLKRQRKKPALEALTEAANA